MKVTIKLTEKRSSREPIEVVHENVWRQQVHHNGMLVLDYGDWEDVYEASKWESFEVTHEARTEHVRSSN